MPRGSGPIGALRVAVRGPALVALVSGGLALLLALRLVEAPIHGAARPWTPAITRFVCRNALRILGIRRRVTGSPLRGGGALVANHSSWLDVFALNSAAPLYFVAKAEVAGWPGIGWLARATGTVFIERRRTEAARHRAQFEERLRAGHLLAFFPEGTSTDGRRLLPFKTTLFEAFFSAGVEGLRVQPVAMIWTAPPGRPDDHFGWWGTMGLGPHLLSVLAAPPGGRVELAFEPPIPVEGGRKTLAARTEAAVRAALEERLGSVPVR
ncbi:lysophospholipid acyltransferase family protein [Hasllibacter halocynthiae]|uniref:lysophospholipid acyltransferase family protein n=1 Tax=Hasllibacter halocynthiae TaxID=595589 RepID=UPI000D06DE09|nr:lysophospholipid acyltransferase family protein [Hasllibacter halocynthiae]